MPSKSKAQQQLMGAAYAAKKNNTPLKNLSPKLQKIVKSMNKKQLKEFAQTSTSNLPEHATKKAGFKAFVKAAMCGNKTCDNKNSDRGVREKKVQKAGEKVKIIESLGGVKPVKSSKKATALNLKQYALQKKTASSLSDFNDALNAAEEFDENAKPTWWEKNVVEPFKVWNYNNGTKDIKRAIEKLEKDKQNAISRFWKLSPEARESLLKDKNVILENGEVSIPAFSHEYNKLKDKLNNRELPKGVLYTPAELEFIQSSRAEWDRAAKETAQSAEELNKRSLWDLYKYDLAGFGSGLGTYGLSRYLGGSKLLSAILGTGIGTTTRVLLDPETRNKVVNVLKSISSKFKKQQKA